MSNDDCDPDDLGQAQSDCLGQTGDQNSLETKSIDDLILEGRCQPPVAAAPAASFAGLPPYQVFTDPSGDDTSGDGTISNPFRTLYKACAAAIALGGGTVVFNDNTEVGGPVPNQGLWLRGDDVEVPGFLQLKGAALRIIGNGNQSGQFTFERPGAAWLIGGEPRLEGDFTKAGIWVVSTGTPILFQNVKNFAPPFYGNLSPVRLGWDYVRRIDGSLENLTVTSATRTAGAPGVPGSTVFTIDLDSATPWIITSADRDNTDTVTLTLARPLTIAMSPWTIGAKIRVATGGDTDFPGGDFDVTNQSDQFFLQGQPSIITVSYQQIGSVTTKPLSGTVKSHGCAPKDRVAMNSTAAQFVTACMYRVTGITIDTVTVTDVYGYGTRSPSASVILAPGTTITIVKQNRGRQVVSATTFNNCSFFGQITPLGDNTVYGPTVDIGGVTAIPLRFNDCYIAGNLNWNWTDFDPINVDFDRTKVSILADPGPAGVPSATAFIARNCTSQDGCVRFYGGSTENDIDIDEWLQDTGGHPLPTISLLEGNPFDYANLNNISLADDTVPAISVGGGFDVNRVQIGTVQTSSNTPIQGGNFIGPRALRSDVWQTPGFGLPSPWVQNWNTIWTGGLATPHVNVNRAMGPLAARLQNIFPSLDHWLDGHVPHSFPAGITVTQDALAPDGSFTAFKIVNANLQDLPPADANKPGYTEIIVGAYPLVSWGVGDSVIIGAWMNLPAEGSLILASYQPNSILFDGSNTMVLRRNIGTTGWQWVTMTARVTSITNGAAWIALHVPKGNNTTYLWAPTLLHSNSGAIDDNDFYEFARNIKHQPTYLQPGTSGTMEDTKFIAHGGLGTDANYTQGTAYKQLTVGSLNAKYIEVFDASGAPLGFAQLFDGAINDPAKIPNLELWLRADTLEGNDDDKIGTWPNSASKSSGSNATQLVTANQPRVKNGANGLNSLPVLRFDAVDGTNDFMFATFEPASTTGMTIFSVHRTGGSLTTYGTVIGSGGGGGPQVNPTTGIQWAIACGTGSNDTFGAGWGGPTALVHFGIVNGLATNTAFYARYRLQKGTPGAWDIDGPNSGTPTDPSFPTETFQCYVGCQGINSMDGTPSVPFLGDIAEILIFSRFLSDLECAAMKTYLKSKWGLP